MENYLPLSLLNPQSATLLLAIGASFMLAGLVKGVLGLGLPTVAMGLLSLLMPPMEAAALLIVPSMATNVWQLAAGPGLAHLLRRLWPMLLAICGGTLAGGALLPRDGDVAAAVALGLALMLYALAGLASVRSAGRHVHRPMAAPPPPAGTVQAMLFRRLAAVGPALHAAPAAGMNAIQAAPGLRIEDAGHLLYAYVAGEQVAALDFTASGNDVTVNVIYVKPCWRRQGIATALTRHLLRRYSHAAIGADRTYTP